MEKEVDALRKELKELQQKYTASKTIIGRLEKQLRQSEATAKKATKENRSMTPPPSSDSSKKNEFQFKPPAHTPGRSKPGEVL